jgi:tol-pal system protein YbgF
VIERVRRRIRVAARALAPVALLATGACFATRNDVAVLQSDIAAMRAEAARADSARAAQVDRVLASLGLATDSLRALSARSLRFQGDVRGELTSMGQQLITIQELTGQSQRRLQELRAGLEQRAEEVGVPPASPGGATPPGAAATPGPGQLFQIAVEQYRRGSFGAARAAFQEYLRAYPTGTDAAEAQYYLAESHAGEQNMAAADSAYAAVVTRYPSSPRAATALYKRALAQQTAGRTAQSRALLERVVKEYPRSEEAVLAREALRAPR